MNRSAYTPLAKALLVCGVLFSSGTLWAQKQAVFSGFVTDPVTQEALPGVHVWVDSLEMGTATNIYGYFSLKLPAADTYRVGLSAIGYQPRSVSVTIPQAEPYRWQLTPAVRELNEVVVQATNPITRLPQMSQHALNLEELERLPSFLGETDVIKSAQYLPGVLRGSEGSNQFFVRGGSADQNLVLLDGVPVYNVNHVFGFLSVFNGDAMQTMELYTGSFPARYGGRISSVLDVTMREGSSEGVQGKVSVGLLATKALVEGPLGEKTQFLLTARRSYLDAVAKPLIEAPAFNRSNARQIFGANFYDVNAKINHRSSDRSRMYLSYYGGRDFFENGEIRFAAQAPGLEGPLTPVGSESISTRWGNQTGALRWYYLLAPSLFSNTRISYTRYQSQILSEEIYYPEDDGPDEVTSAEYQGHIQDFAFNSDFDWSPWPRHKVRFGVNTTYQQVQPSRLTVQNPGLRYVVGEEVVGSWQGYTYIEDEFSVGKRLSARAGLHLAVFQVGDGWYPSWQPRTSVNVQLAPGWSLKGSWGRMTQYIHQVTTASQGLPLDQWVPSTARYAPQEAWQGSLGLAAELKGGWTVSVEGYRKVMDNLLEFASGASYFNPFTPWEDKLTQGTGHSYGVEVMARKREGRLTGWASYTYGRSWRHFEEINFGERFPHRYDRPHTVNVVGGYRLKDGLTLGGTWVLTSGENVTLQQGNALLPTPPLITSDMAFSPNSISSVAYYGGRNYFRMPAYHRLDLSLSSEKPRKKGEGTRTWKVGLYNAYARKNPMYYKFQERYFLEGGVERQFVQFVLVPLPLPFVSYQITF